MEAGTQVITAASRVVCSHAPTEVCNHILSRRASFIPPQRDQVSVKARNAFLFVWPCFVFGYHREAEGYHREAEGYHRETY